VRLAALAAVNQSVDYRDSSVCPDAEDPDVSAAFSKRMRFRITWGKATNNKGGKAGGGGKRKPSAAERAAEAQRAAAAVLGPQEGGAAGARPRSTAVAGATAALERPVTAAWGVLALVVRILLGALKAGWALFDDPDIPPECGWFSRVANALYWALILVLPQQLARYNPPNVFVRQQP
jgi:hypothetical protein